ncbi:unnamed protein product, partial [marine sediment metagenome]
DVNDVNDIVEALSTIANAREFADDTQKKQLLADEFVKDVLLKAIDKAAEFEAAGKWVEAYTNCYVWLKAIDPDNQGYCDYADLLLDKAVVAAAFEDNPCETSQERFGGVKKEMFIRSIVFLDMHYVSIIDYRQMARKAIERCELMARVLGTSTRFSRDLQSKDTAAPKPKKSAAGKLAKLLFGQPEQKPFVLPDTAELTAWLESLKELANEYSIHESRVTSHESQVTFDKRK